MGSGRERRATKHTKYTKNGWAPAGRVLGIQTSYLAGYPDEILCETPITPGTCYEIDLDAVFHDRVMKGGAHHPCAWDSDELVLRGYPVEVFDLLIKCDDPNYLVKTCQ